VRALVPGMARGHPGRGCRRVHGELAGPGRKLAPPAVRRILRDAGTGPAPGRSGQAWRAFPEARAKILATGFFRAGIVLLRRLHVFVTGHGTRRVHMAGITAHPAGERVAGQARNLLVNLEDRADGFKFLIRDRDARFTAASGAVLTAAGIRVIKAPAQAPRAIAERRIAGARRECPGRMRITGERHPRLVLDEHAGHCSTRRPHRALQHGAPAGRPHPPDPGGCVRVLRRDRPGGLIHEYSRVA
jgi:putative transposase